MSQTSRPRGELYIAEMKEFGSFHKKTQRYIRQALDVAFRRGDPLQKWGRTQQERDDIRTQQHNYELLLNRVRMRLDRAGGISIGHSEHITGPLIGLATFDLSCGKLPGFGPFRFLYERLFGAEVRPWLPGVYCAAAASPLLYPVDRKNLLHAISEQSACAESWSKIDPLFLPEWVEKVDMNPPPEPKKLPPPSPPPSDEQPSPEPPKEDA
jgi:hypothetical protein